MAVRRVITPARSSESGRASARVIGGPALPAFLACLFVTVIAPLIIFVTDDRRGVGIIQPLNRIFWPAVAILALIIAFKHRSQLYRLQFPIHNLFVFAYLAIAGASILWAFNPEITMIRLLRQVCIVTAIIIPSVFAYRRPDLLRSAFICYAIGAVLNVYFVFQNPVSIVLQLNGHPGYFTGKNYLGEFAAAALILALHEICYTGRRRVVGFIISITAIMLLVWSNSKTALGLAVAMPSLAVLILIAARFSRLSPAFLLFAIPVGFMIVTTVTGITSGRIAYAIYGDSTFTGRTFIWAFADYEISRKPLLGWGYQSFWLVGPTGPSSTATGWVRRMPNSHDGYRDVILETGYVGLTIVLCFIFATVHAIGRIAERQFARGWVLLSLALYVIGYNFLESLWFRGYEFLWVLCLLVAADTEWFQPRQRSRQLRPPHRRRHLTQVH